jgi:hypothetical protein
MAKVKEKSMDYYIEQIESHLLKKYPDLQFKMVKLNDRKASIHYTPYVEDELFSIVHRAGNLMADAIVDAGYSILVLPGQPDVETNPRD